MRTRHSFGNQGDLDRIKVQQQFLGSLMRKMSSGDTLTSPTKLIDLAEAATKALTVDTGIGSVSTPQGHGAGAEEGAAEEHHLHHRRR